MRYAIETTRCSYGIECIALLNSKEEADKILAILIKSNGNRGIWMRDVEDNIYSTVYGIHKDNMHTEILATFDEYEDAKSWYNAQKHMTYNYGSDPAKRDSAYMGERCPGYGTQYYSVFKSGTPLYGFEEGSLGTSEYKHQNHNPPVDRKGWQLRGRREVERNIHKISDERKIYYWMSRIYNSLSDDLLKPGYTGHCYVASEALYHLTNKTLIPKCMRIPKANNVVHWWLENPPREGRTRGHVYDITADQFSSTWIEYSHGRGRGFLTKEPSKRAQTLINRAIKGTYKCPNQK